MTPDLAELPDPRSFPDASSIPAWAAEVHALAAAALRAETGQAALALEDALTLRLRRMLRDEDGDALATLMRLAPSVAVHRHVARALADLARRPGAADEPLTLVLFALPVVVVAATSSREAEHVCIPGVLTDVDAVRDVLQKHRALGGNESFALGAALAPADAIGWQRLPSLLATRALREDRPPLDVPPADIEVVADERAHLRFIVGSALAAAGADLFASPQSTAWAMPLARALIAQLARPGISLVALPRPAADLATARSQGRAAQRDVSAQLFASSALRSLRAEAGEPSAVISAHRAADAPGGGELRLSLSSPLAPRAAQGFRCAILPMERVVDVAAMLADLMRDCRVADVRVVPGVHADRDALTGGPLLFKPETLPTRAVH